MPRKKTVQPDPAQVFVLDDGTVVEVRDDDCLEIGRGLHNRNEFERKRDQILEEVVNDYFHPDPNDPTGKKWMYGVPRNKDYLSSASKFALEFQLRGFGAQEGDDSALRKKIYPDIMGNVRSYRKVL